MRSPGPRTPAGRRGLNDTGHIVREGSLDRIGAAFRAAATDARRQIGDLFRRRLHSAYLYGSVPRGTAVPGRSDLDVLITLRSDPLDAERSVVRDLAQWLADRHPEIDGAGLLLYGAPRILSPAERYDLGFFVACLCTPLLGDDLAGLLPWYRPTRELARETNGDLGPYLARAAAQLAGPGADRPRLVRAAARKVARTGFTLVMPRWHGWTSDLDLAAEVFGRYYPDRADQMRQAVILGRQPRSRAEPGRWEAGQVLVFHVLGPWLADEYTREIGVKHPRP